MTFSYVLYGIYPYALWHFASRFMALATCSMAFSYMLYGIYLHAYDN